MKRVLVMVLVCVLLAVSVAGRPLPAVKAAGEVLYAEVPQDSYCRAPATTAYLSIKQGSLTASSDGSFAAATVNGTYPGYKATVTRNSTVSVFVTGTQVSSTYTTARIRIIRNGSVVLSPLDFTISGSNFTQNYSITIPENSYVRVEVLYGTTAGWLGKCFVNPVFVAVTG
jgi:hypothetical protein